MTRSFGPRCSTWLRPLHGRNKDELDGEDIRQNRRTMRIARGVAVAMALLAAAAVWQAIVANQQRNEAIAQRGVAERETARAVTQEGIANQQRDIAEKQTIEARNQKTIADRERDEAVRQRDLALSRRLVSDSSRQLANPLQWDLAMVLAIESMRKAPTADNYELLARLSSEGARVVASFPGENLVAFSPDSRLVATGGSGKSGGPGRTRRTRAGTRGHGQRRVVGHLFHASSRSRRGLQR